MSKQTETAKPAAMSRRDQNAELYRRHNWHLFTHNTLEKGQACKITLERWIQEGTNRISLVVITQMRGDQQSVENFFQGGGHTWEELERALVSDPVVVEFDKDDRSELFHIIKNRGNCATRNKLIDALRKIDPGANLD